MSKSLGQSQVKTSQAWHHEHNLYKKKSFDKLYFVNIFKFCPMKDPVKWVERRAMGEDSCKPHIQLGCLTSKHIKNSQNSTLKKPPKQKMGKRYTQIFHQEEI